MTNDQLLIFAVLGAVMLLFLWGRWRHDLIAMCALLVCVVSGLVPSNAAFAGFGHPAVITVACVLVLSYGLQITGVVDQLATRLLPSGTGPTVSMFAIVGLAAVFSGFMNNVGALALFMPIGIQLAARLKLPAGKVLMPLSFGSILGGMTTLIGTPPNLIVSGFRSSAGWNSFAMFDFVPVGVAVAVIGILFIGLIGWRMVPARPQLDLGSFEFGTYLSEVLIKDNSKVVNKSLREVELLLDEADAQIVGLVRGDVRMSAPNPRRALLAGDILIIEIEPESLTSALSSLGLELVEDVSAHEGSPEQQATGETRRGDPEDSDRSMTPVAVIDQDIAKSGEVVIQELVVMANSSLVHRSASDIEIRTRFHINLLAISRQGRRSIKRLRSTEFQAGDVLLVQGAPEAIFGFASEFGCLPLAPRGIRVPKNRQALVAATLMVVAVSGAAFGLLPAAISFSAAVLCFIVFGLIPVRSLYTAIDWPVVVLLGAMLPVADAMTTTGAADFLARVLLDKVALGGAVTGLVVLLVVTMFLSDVMNNAATAAVMCPIAISMAHQFHVNVDTFLMTIAVGASCAFLTPIGHQNNTLILGPGGFRFGDYWKMGLLLEMIVVAVSVPMLLWAWPL